MANRKKAPSLSDQSPGKSAATSSRHKKRSSTSTSRQWATISVTTENMNGIINGMTSISVHENYQLVMSKLSHIQAEMNAEEDAYENKLYSVSLIHARSE